MGRPKSMIPALGIIDDIDAPQAGNLIVVWTTPSRTRWEYVDCRMPLQKLDLQSGSWPSEFTELTEFGVWPAFEPNGDLAVFRWGACTARYHDGKPRRWQDRWEIARITMRPSLAAHVLMAVSQLYRRPEAPRAKIMPREPAATHSGK